MTQALVAMVCEINDCSSSLWTNISSKANDFSGSTTKSIFAMSTCCIQIDEILLTEAARMAQLLGYHRALGVGDSRHRATCYRTFWVIYYMEKHMGFNFQKGSVSSSSSRRCSRPLALARLLVLANSTQLDIDHSHR